METENNILDNVEYKEMLAQLEDLRNYYLENKEKQNYLNKEMLTDLLNDYRRIYQIIYKLIENKD